MLPKNFQKDIKVVNDKIGPERRRELVENIANKGTFLPKSVLEEDIDLAFINFIKNDINLTIDGVKVPVLFLTIQRWAEYTRTWQFTDEYRNIELPFITIVRKPDIQQGENQAGLWNIPGNRTYTYMRVPNYTGVRTGVDLYKIPQPVSVDMVYDVRLFTNRMTDLNLFNRTIQRFFQSRQYYINVNNHPMPVLWESISDESEVDDFQTRRFYSTLYELKVMGYIMDENDFEVVPTLDRVLVTSEIDEGIIKPSVVLDVKRTVNDVTFTFIFKPRTDGDFTFTAQYGVIFNLLTDIEFLSRILIVVNGNTVLDGTVISSPITINEGDTVFIRGYKNLYETGKFQLIGNTL